MTPTLVLVLAFLIAIALGGFVYVLAVTGADQPDDGYDE